MNDDKNHDQVRTRAYHIWETAGRPDGDHDSHWHQARAEVDASDPSFQPDRAAPLEPDGSSAVSPQGKNRVKR